MKTDKEDFEEYSLEDEEEQSHPMALPQIWLTLLKAMIMPSQGWKKIRESDLKPDSAVIGFLLPMSLLAAISNLFSIIYDIDLKYTDLLVGMVVSFFTYFLGYYIAVLIARIFVPTAVRDFPMSNYGRNLITGCMGTLAMIHIIYEAFQLFDFVIEFFPLWIVFMLYKGMSQVNTDSNKATYTLGVMCVAVISSPVLIEWFFSFFTPTA